MIKKLVFFILLLGSFLSGKLLAQIQADFSADTTTFCPPRIVQFFDQSSGSGITYRHWVFSPSNQSIGNQLNPSASYTTPGTYDVTLTISNGVDTSTITKSNFITVWQAPSVQFSSSSVLSGCAPLTVSFQNSTTQGDAPISSYTWTFGDNSAPVSAATPTHTYTQSGQFTVNLLATDQNGCSSSKDSVQMVTVFPKPTADFSSAQSPHNCQTPHTVNYVNLSTGSGLNFQWDLGNGTTSQQLNPSVIYTNPGVFDIQLIVTDTNGCSDTAFKPQFASATATVADFLLLDTVFCLGSQVSFSNISVGGSNARWNYGDGSPIGTTWDGSNSYSATGTYTVTLEVFSSAACRDTIQKNIYIQDVKADFSISDPYGCEVPHFTTFSPLNPDPTFTYNWDFGDNIGNGSGINPGYNYTGFGTFSPKLTVISPYGCTDSLRKFDSVYVFEVVPDIIVDDPDGCAPITVQFINNSTPKDSLVSAFWDFDDAGATASGDTVSHTFTNPGTYFVWLTVATADSCLYQKQQIVEVGSHQTPDFFPDTIRGCAADSARFWNLSVDTSLITGYTWIFSDGQQNSNKNPVVFMKDTGWIDVTLITDYNGCKDTLVKKQVFQSLGPVAEFTQVIDCSNPFQVQFNGIIKAADSTFWEYGDGNVDTNNSNPIHTYTASSDYNVFLRAVNSTTGCRSEFTQIAKVRNLRADFQFTDSLGCAPLTVGFNGSASKDNLPYIFEWFLDGVNVQSGLANHQERFKDPGTYEISLVTMDINNCIDTAYQNIYVFRPTANFTVDTSWGCAPFLPQFSDLSTSDTNIVQWDWDFGNGTQATLSNPVGSYNPNKPTSYDVSLTVTDTFGCKHDTVFPKLVRAHVPRINIKADQTLCAGDSVSFRNTFHHPGNGYSWIFGNGQTSTQSHPSTVYGSGGLYDVWVRVTDSLGCVDTADLAQFIDVQSFPNPVVVADPKDTSCYPAIIRFDEISNNPNLQSTKWFFGDSSSPVVATSPPVFNTYTQPGVYTVKVVATTTYGCTDSVELVDYVSILGPNGVFELSDDSICTGEEVELLLDSAFNVYAVEWDFGDGNDSTVIGPNNAAQHQYNFPGKLLVRGIARDSSLNCPKVFEDTVYIHEMHTKLSLDTNAGCIPFRPFATDASVGANDYGWNLLGASGWNAPMSVNLDTAGEFELRWIAENTRYGCSDTTTTLLNVYPLPDPIVKDEIHLCIGDSMELTATDGVEYRWSPFEGLTNYFEDTVTGAPKKDVTYTVVVKDEWGCINSAKTKVFVVDTPTFMMVTDTVVNYGEPFILWVESPDSIKVVWFNDASLSCGACILSEATPLNTTTYPVQITDYNGCFAVDTNVTLTVNEDIFFFIPNAFTPNGDGLNDQLKVVSKGYKSVKRFQIYDRWGQLIFETRDLSNQWDGTRNGNLIEHTNVFNYVIELERFTGDIDQKTGIITLVR